MKTISFVIPVFNEEQRIDKTFKALAYFKAPKGLRLSEVIFVDDGSKDKTVLKINKIKAKLAKKLKTKIKIVSYSKNQGKGYAVKKGMLSSKADYTLFFDADMSTPLSELNKFIPFIGKGTDVIIGTRKNGKSTVLVHQPKIRELLGKGFTLLTKTILRLNVTDFTCGFKAFSKKAKDQIFTKSIIKRWGYDAEIIFLASKYEFTIAEKAVIWSNDKDTKVKLYKAVPETFAEIFKIYWAHEIKPAILFIFKDANIINRYGLSI